MIETALVFALGALCSGIVALLLYPAFTRRAARLARRDMEARLPRTLDEIAALRDGVRAEYAARTARVESALATANGALTDERIAKADMSVQLAALRTERRGYEASLAEAEDRVTATFAELREREERLARALAENRDLERRLSRIEERVDEAEARAGEAERLAGEMRMALVAAEASSMAVSDTFAARSGMQRPWPAPVVQQVQTAKDGPAADAADPRPVAAADAPILLPDRSTERPDDRAEPAAPVREPAVGGLRPEIAATFAERLRAARDRPPRVRSGDDGGGDKRAAEDQSGVQAARDAPERSGPSLPVAAEWSIPLPSVTVEAATDADDADDTVESGDAVAWDRLPDDVTASEPPDQPPPAATTPSRQGKTGTPPLFDERLPKLSRRFPRPGQPTYEPVVTAREPQEVATPVPVVVPRDAVGQGHPEDVHADLGPNFVPQPIPVVIRPARPPEHDALPFATPDAAEPAIPDEPDAGPAELDEPAAAETDQTEQQPAVADAEDEAPESEPETFAISYSFPPIAAPTALPDIDLAPEERSRRVEDLAARLRSLRSRNAAARRSQPVVTADAGGVDEDGETAVVSGTAKSPRS